MGILCNYAFLMDLMTDWLAWRWCFGTSKRIQSVAVAGELIVVVWCTMNSIFLLLGFWTDKVANQIVGCDKRYK